MKIVCGAWTTFLLFIGLLIIFTTACSKSDAPDPPVVKDPYGMFTYAVKPNGIVSFTNTSTDATSYLWDFGDSTTSTTSLATFEHQYVKNGTYKATLTAYGNGKSAGAYANLTITTATGTIPAVETSATANVTQTSATCGGNVTSDGGSTVTARGVCWSTSQNPLVSDSKTIDGSGTGNFTSDIIGLAPHTIYYLRAYATNSSGTGYGNEVSFVTLPNIGGLITDIDGNVYHTIVIGSQVWMAENLKTTRYSNGDAIANVTDSIAWRTLTDGAFCYYNNVPANSNTYGILYNWHAAKDARNIAPAGWRVATDDDWTKLTDFLGNTSNDGGKLKEAGTIHWQSPNMGATNETGFTALPGGFRGLSGTFVGLWGGGNWWSSTEYQSNNAWSRGMSYNLSSVNNFAAGKNYGFSIRCVKDL